MPRPAAVPLRSNLVTGCSAQIDPARYAAMAEVDQVLGNAEKMQARSFLDLDARRVRVNDIASIRETAGHLAAEGRRGAGAPACLEDHTEHPQDGRAKRVA